MKAAFTLVGTALDVREVAAEWAGAATLGDLLEAARAQLPHRDPPVTVDGHQWGVATPLDRCGLRDGSVVSLSATHGQHLAPTDPSAYLHLAVTSGPGAGTVVALPSGTTVVGRLADAALVLPDPAVSGHHLALHVGTDGVVVLEDLGSSNGTAVNGEAVTGRVPLGPGQVIRVGDTRLEVRPGTPPDAVVHPDGGTLEVRRPPRLLAAAIDTEITWPTEPGPPSRQPFPLAASLAPLAIGVFLFLTFHSLIYVVFIAMSPLMAIVNVVTSRRTGKARHKKDTEQHAIDLTAAEAQLLEAGGVESAVRHQAAPDPATVLGLVSGPRRRLWAPSTASSTSCSSPCRR